MNDEIPPHESLNLPPQNQEDFPPSRLPRRRDSNGLQGAIADVFRSIYRRNKLINQTIKMLLDIQDENEMLDELALVLAKEDDRFSEVFARACELKIRQSESFTKMRRQREAAASEAQPPASSPRGFDSASAVTDMLERRYSTDEERMKLLLTATRRYMVHGPRAPRSSGD